MIYNKTVHHCLVAIVLGAISPFAGNSRPLIPWEKIPTGSIPKPTALNIYPYKKTLDFWIGSFSLDKDGGFFIKYAADSTWISFDSLFVKYPNYQNFNLPNPNYIRFDIGKEIHAYEQNVWDLAKSKTGLVKTTFYRNWPYRFSDSIFYGHLPILFKEQYSNSFPDSAITGFGITNNAGKITNGYNAILWVGTWGQGVYTSQDSGYTWSPQNSGINDLHIASLFVPDWAWQDTVVISNSQGWFLAADTASEKPNSITEIKKSLLFTEKIVRKNIKYFKINGAKIFR